MDSFRQGETGSFSREKKTGTVYVPSEIAQNLKVADEDASFRYDETARNLVAEKPVLAYILKSALDEYAGYTVQEIAERFIEGEPELRKIAVHQDHPDRIDDPSMMSGDNRIEGRSTADKSQRGTIFKDQEYGKIKKSVSIWVCEDTANLRSDTINRYSITEENLRGDFREDKKDYDLMTVVVLRLGSKGEKSGDNGIRLLCKMFSTNLSYEDKLDTLQNEFKISVSREMSEEVLDLCNLSTGVYNKGYDSGYGSGLSAGEMKKAREMAYKLQDKGMVCEEIADMVEVSIDTIREWLSQREEMLVK